MENLNQLTLLSSVENAHSKTTTTITLESVLHDIHSGRYENQIEQVRAAYKQGGKKAAGPLKGKLPAILFSGLFNERNDGGIQQHSGILVADLDELEDRIPELRDRLAEDRHVLFVFLSPTGSGLKVGFRVPADAQRHADSFAAVAAHVVETHGETIDPACKNLSRLCFVSHDPNIRINRNAKELPVPDQTLPAQGPDEQTPSIYGEIEERYGKPFYKGEFGAIHSINQRFWAGLYLAENHLLYEPNEGSFYSYSEDNGLWSSITDEALRELIAARLLGYSREESGEAFERKINRATLDTIIAHLKGQSEKSGIFEKKKRIVHCANGVLRLQPEGDAMVLKGFSMEDYSRNQSPISFAQEAGCPRFLNELIQSSVDNEDALLIQKWMGLALLGDNAPQKFLILDGQPGGGKSTLINIIRSVVGSQNVYQLRTQQLGERFELFRFTGKTLLIGSDVSGKFLMQKHAHVIKSLVGGDPLSGEAKNSNGSFDITGNFNIVISCNTRLKVLLEGDIGAWKRRLLIARYEKSPPEKPIPGFDVQLVEEEGSGILNWALEGLQLALADIEEIGTLTLGQSQKKRIEALLAESESVRNFIKKYFVRDHGESVTSDEIIQSYAEYCSDQGWTPLPVTTVQQQLPDLMLEFFRTSKSHCLERNGKKSLRGWKGVRLIDTTPEYLNLGELPE